MERGAGLNATQAIARRARRRRSLSCNANNASSPAPPPPRFARSASSSGPPPPLSRGRKVRAIAFSRRASRPSFAARTKATDVSPPNKKGRRSAGRRKSNGPHHTNRCRHLPALRARRAPRTIRLREPPASGALAFRRSTAALAEVSRPRLFDFRPGFLGRRRCAGVTRACLSQSSGSTRAPAVIPADMMPEAARERFARPPAGTALAPLSGSHLESARSMARRQRR